MSTTCLGLGGLRPGERGLLATSVGLALDDEFPGGGLQPVDGGLGEQRVGERGQPLIRVRLEVMMVAVLRCRSTAIS